jgi:maltose O-acetyltransferase
MKSELEKMLAGEMYMASDIQLTTMRNKARQLFTKYNQTLNENVHERILILDKLIANKGTNIDIQPPFFCDYGSHIKLGSNVFINYNCTILDCAEVVIGNHVFIAPSVHIYTAYHPLRASERNIGLEAALPICIEDNVWIGGNVTICAGVTIGKNSTIGAGSVVTKNIPSNSLAVGNPCKVIRNLQD